MKKRFLIFFLLLTLICAFLLTKIDLTVQTDVESTKFARITKSTIFYELPSKISENNQKFILEESYFVNVLKEEGDFFYVKYLDLSGYVLKENLFLVNEQIQNPYLDNITFSITKNTHLYSRPFFNDEYILEDLEPTNKVFYYGKIFGENFDESGNVWYYLKISKNNQELRGYIHSSMTNNLSPITENQEYSSQFVANQEKVNKLLSLDFNSQGMIIVIISVPILFLLFLFTKGFKRIK